MEKSLSNYCFFIQPQINSNTDNIVGYELLLRENILGQWVRPKNFTSISIESQLDMVENTLSLIKYPKRDSLSLSFNINARQAIDPFTIGKIISFYKRISPVSLIIEFTERVPLNLMKKYCAFLHPYGIKLALDDVGTGSNTFENVEHILPYVDRVKFAIQNYRESTSKEKMLHDLNKWVEVVKKYRLGITLEGVESRQDQVLAKKLGISIHQGYLYGKPTLP